MAGHAAGDNPHQSAETQNLLPPVGPWDLVDFARSHFIGVLAPPANPAHASQPFGPLR